ncbi:unnamed protein product, partial [Strongylus vulgaris]
MNVFIEGDNRATTSSGEAGNNTGCYFPTKIYNAEIVENAQGRRKLVKVTSSCETEGRPYEYSLVYATDQFELNPKTGELFAILPLDRERRSYNFLYIEVSPGADKISAERRVIRENPVIEKAKAKLNSTQTLVVVRVLDENDNAPAFLHGTDDDDA